MINVTINSICLQVNKWSDPRVPDWPLIDLLAGVKAAGFNDIEAWGPHLTVLDADGVTRLAEALDESGIEIACVGAYIPLKTGQPLDEFWLSAGKYLTVCTDLGISMLRVFPSWVASAKATDEDWDYIPRLLAAFSTEAAFRDVTVVAETHDNTLADTVEGALRLMESVDHLNFKLLFQTLDFQTDSTLAQWEAIRKHVRHVHLQNRDANEAFTPLAGGTMDYRKLIGRMRADGYDGDMSIEFTADCAPAEASEYDLEKVLSNASADRRFVLDCWSGSADEVSA